MHRLEGDVLDTIVGNIKRFLTKIRELEKDIADNGWPRLYAPIPGMSYDEVTQEMPLRLSMIGQAVVHHLTMQLQYHRINGHISKQELQDLMSAAGEFLTMFEEGEAE